MKKILLSLAFSWMAASSLFAAKAKPGVCRLMMTDGSYVSATLKGDENSLTEDDQRDIRDIINPGIAS